MELDFDATEESKDYVTVPPGSYACRVAEVRQRNTRNGEPLWALRLVVSEGEHTGRQAAWDNLVFSVRGRARVRRIFETFGLPAQGKVNVEPADLEGKEALVEVRAAEYKSPSGDIIKRNEVPYDGYRQLLRDETVAQAPAKKNGKGKARGDQEEIPF
jgi:hypothetical protein